MGHSYFTFTSFICIIANIKAYNIDCSTTICRDTTIDCPPNEPCNISCTSAQSCYGTTFNCPIGSGDCEIHCRGGESCRESIINATLSTGNFNLLCEESTDHCRDITIYGSTLEDTNIGNYNIICEGNQRACINANIQCPLNSDCSISCLSDTSCRKSRIIGPVNGDLNIECSGIKSCFDGVFDASKSQSLDINGCSNDESCFDLSLYCPLNSNGIPNCYIEGNNNIGRDNAKGTKIYAINGWNDIIIDYNGTFGAFHDGMMFCGENYDIKCVIASDSWACINYNDYCNFNPTISPTNSPIITIETTNIFPAANITNINIITPSNTNSSSSLIIKIISSIAAVTIICGCIICIKLFRKWFSRAKGTNSKSKNRNEGEEDSDLFGFVLKVTGSDERDFMDDTMDEASEPGQGRTDNIKSKLKTKKHTLDPLDISYNYTQPLQQQRSITDNTYLSQPISELDSPNCIPIGNSNRFSTDLSKYNSHKMSDISLNDNANVKTYNPNAVIKEYITPRPPPRNSKNFTINVSPPSSNKSSFSEGISTIHTSETTQESDINKADSFSDIYNVVERKPTTEL